MVQADLNIILPEILLSLFAMLALLGAVYGRKDGIATSLIWVTAALFIIAAFSVMRSANGTEVAFNGMFTVSYTHLRAHET